MLEHQRAVLMSLLDAAVPPNVFAASRTAEKPDRSTSPNDRSKPSTTQTDSKMRSSISEGVAVISFLLERGALDLSNYPAWNRLAIAFKNSYAEDGFAPWLAFSEAADGFDSEDACRKAWDAIKPRKEGEQLTIATYIAQAKELGWKSARGSGRPGSSRTSGGDATAGEDAELGSEGSGSPRRQVDPAAYTIELVEEAGDELWVDQEGKAHVTFEIPLPDGSLVTRHAPIGSSLYKGLLQTRYHAAAKTKVLKKDQVDTAASLLEFQARESGIQHAVALRVGELEGHIYVDLGTPDGAAVEIDGEGYRVVPKAPMRFVRGTRGELPVPAPGGLLEDFKRHFNLSGDDLQRLLGYMVGAFNGGASYAILMVDGEQGSGKSTLADKIVGLIDPPTQTKNARMSFSAKERDLHIGALGVHMPYFDNVSTFTADAADALCRMSTGGGSGSRKLYTDDQYSQMVVVRPILLTCIGPPTTRPDLLDRSVRITARTLQKRRTERAVIRAYDADRPKMLGFLYSCVSAALRNRPKVEEAVECGDVELPRMADFAEFVEGASELLDLPLGGFSALLTEGQSAMQVEAVIGHPVGAGLIKYFSQANTGELNAPARDILTTLKGLLSGGDQRWPPTNMLSKALKRLSVGLRHLGIEWEATEPEGRENVARYRIWVTEKFVPQSDGVEDGGGRF